MTPNPIHIEEAGLNAWPALQTNLYDGWILRLANGYTKRANSVTPLYGGALPLDEKIAFCEDIYKRHQQPVIFRLPSFHPDAPEIDATLAERGYEKIDETSVQVADLSWANYEENDRAQNLLYPAHWLPTFHRLDQSHSANETHKRMLNNIVGKTNYLVLHSNEPDSNEPALEKRKTVACGLGICQGNLVGLYDIVVGAEHRRKGYGAELVEGLLEWGVESCQAQVAYLSVVASNEPALKLYERYGFGELYRYHYRVNSW